METRVSKKRRLSAVAQILTVLRQQLGAAACEDRTAANQSLCEAVTAAMSSFDDWEVAEYGCEAVAAFAQDTTNSGRLGEAGACEAVTAALREYGDYRDVAMEGLLAVALLARNTDNSDRLGEAGACEAVTALLKKEWLWEECASYGCNAVARLARDIENSSRLGKAGACEVVTALLKEDWLWEQNVAVLEQLVVNFGSFHEDWVREVLSTQWDPAKWRRVLVAMRVHGVLPALTPAGRRAAVVIQRLVRKFLLSPARIFDPVYGAHRRAALRLEDSYRAMASAPGKQKNL